MTEASLWRTGKHTGLQVNPSDCTATHGQTGTFPIPVL